MEKLKEQRIPGEVLEQLDCLHGKTYSSKAECMSAVESVVGSDVAGQYRALLVRYAHYKKRNRSPKLPEISIGREGLCPVDGAQLPHKGTYEEYCLSRQRYFCKTLLRILLRGFVK